MPKLRTDLWTHTNVLHSYSLFTQENRSLRFRIFIPDPNTDSDWSAKGSHQKKKVKKFHNKCEIRGGGGQQILVCEPQKSAFFRANFPKKHAEINS